MKRYENLKEKVYSIVKYKIIAGDYRPNSHLDEKALITELEVSRTPFREAMNRLELEGFINIIPRRGFFVSEISIKNINDIFQSRLIIEPQLIESSINFLPVDKLILIREQFTNWETTSRTILNDIDWEFHDIIVEASKNEYLIKMMRNIYEHNQRVRTLALREFDREEESAMEHIKIIDALLQKDIEKAKQLCVEHTRNSQLDALNRIGLFNL